MADPSTIQDPYDGGLWDFYDAKAPHLIDRWSPLTEWMNIRAAFGVDASFKANAARVGRRVQGFDRSHRRLSGINFASEDYLCLASHPTVIGAALEAAMEFGMHSAGPAETMGLSTLSLTLESRLARFLEVDEATVFPSEWEATYGAVHALVRASDHIVIDRAAASGLQEAATAATHHIHRVAHSDVDAVAKALSKISAQHPEAGILVVTKSLFSQESDIPDLTALQRLTKVHGATLVVDVANDLGALGPGGRGVMGTLGLLGKVDVVTGSFAKCFASNGGFVASNHPALKMALRMASGPQSFSNALSPVQAAAILAAFDVIDSAEGEAKRERLMANAIRLREGLMAHGFDVLGVPSPIVVVKLGPPKRARLITADVLASGGVVNLVEPPAVGKDGCRWRLMVMADHDPADIDTFVAIAAGARDRQVGDATPPRRPTLEAG